MNIFERNPFKKAKILNDDGIHNPFGTWFDIPHLFQNAFSYTENKNFLTVTFFVVNPLEQVDGEKVLSTLDIGVTNLRLLAFRTKQLSNAIGFRYQFKIEENGYSLKKADIIFTKVNPSKYYPATVLKRISQSDSNSFLKPLYDLAKSLRSARGAKKMKLNNFYMPRVLTEELQLLTCKFVAVAMAKRKISAYYGRRRNRTVNKDMMNYMNIVEPLTSFTSFVNLYILYYFDKRDYYFNKRELISDKYLITNMNKRFVRKS